jgi:hypothetical protein
MTGIAANKSKKLYDFPICLNIWIGSGYDANSRHFFMLYRMYIQFFLGGDGGDQVNYCEICSSTWKNTIKSTVVHA